MDNDRIVEHLKEICWTPEPEEKKAFFQGLVERGLTSRRPEVINHGDFLLRQFFYVGKWIWLLSAVLLLCITGICYGNTGNYPFANIKKLSQEKVPMIYGFRPSGCQTPLF